MVSSTAFTIPQLELLNSLTSMRKTILSDTRLLDAIMLSVTLGPVGPIAAYCIFLCLSHGSHHSTT